MSIDEIESTVQLSDTAALHDPEFMESIVFIVMERMRDAQRHQERMDRERELWPGVSSRPNQDWA